MISTVRLLGTAVAQLGGQAVRRLRPQHAGAPDGQSATHSSEALENQLLRGQLLARVSHLEGNESQRRRQVFRIFLELVLVSRFGPALASDPGFANVLDQVQQAMEADPVLRVCVDKAMDEVLKGA